MVMIRDALQHAAGAKKMRKKRLQTDLGRSCSGLSRFMRSCHALGNPVEKGYGWRRGIAPKCTALIWMSLKSSSQNFIPIQTKKLLRQFCKLRTGFGLMVVYILTII
jgi:hypothetical protein